MNKNTFHVTLGGILRNLEVALELGKENFSSFLKKLDLPDEVLRRAGAEKEDINQDCLSLVTSQAYKITRGINGDFGAGDSPVLLSIFNHLNGNNKEMKYSPGNLEEKINFPSNDPAQGNEYYKNSVKELESRLSLCKDHTGEDYLNFLLGEISRLYVYSPGETEKKSDVPLSDLSKLTGGIAACIYLYFERNGDKKDLLSDFENLCAEDIFYLFSMDISGIQDFIYNIISSGALRALRSRSLYLELIMENLVDDVLDACSISRANLVYCGGGHAYILLPNTESVRSVLDNFTEDANSWFRDKFGADLYLSRGGRTCSVNRLMNRPAGSYGQVFKNVSREISEKKVHRYTARQIRKFNRSKNHDGRECPVCHRSDHLTKAKDGTIICETCKGIQDFANKALKADFFVVTSGDAPLREYLPLPGDKKIYAVDIDEENHNSYANAEKLKNCCQSEGFVRVYSKNLSRRNGIFPMGIFMGDYREIENLNEDFKDEGMIRVLRADVDNLGKAFVEGFSGKAGGNDYSSLSRSAAFSSKLASFFKFHINGLLRNGEYKEFYVGQEGKRKAAVVYSGGDDLFILGSLEDIISFAVDLYGNLKEFSEGALSISAGIGLYHYKDPISTLARLTGGLEDAAKEVPGKDRICLFSEDFSFKWDEFIENVLNEKYRVIKKYFTRFGSDDPTENFSGQSFLYNLLLLIQEYDSAQKESLEMIEKGEEDKTDGGKINLARYVYLISRARQDENNANEEIYNEFSEKMYSWLKNPQDRRQLLVAINIYIYIGRLLERRKNGKPEKTV